MRVYLPATVPTLALARKGGAFEEGLLGGGAGNGVAAHAVTPAVREWYLGNDLEDLEYSAMLDAAEASLSLLAADPDAPRRRVVVSADVSDAAVTPGGRFRSSVVVGVPVPLAAVVSIHVDEPEAEATIEAAVQALAAAAAGDDDAQFLIDEAEACDLLWYDVSELGDLTD